MRDHSLKPLDAPRFPGAGPCTYIGIADHPSGLQTPAAQLTSGAGTGGNAFSRRFGRPDDPKTPEIAQTATRAGIRQGHSVVIARSAAAHGEPVEPRGNLVEVEHVPGEPSLLRRRDCQPPHQVRGRNDMRKTERPWGIRGVYGDSAGRSDRRFLNRRLSFRCQWDELSARYREAFRRNRATHRPSILMWERGCGKPRCFRYL